jgi:MEMO1 family protein
VVILGLNNNEMKRFAFLWYSVLLLIVVPISCMGQEKGKTTYIRPPAVAGSFYPIDSAQLKNQLGDFFSLVRKPVRYSNVAALIVPHAGYVFSGQVAASGYAQLDPEKKYTRIFLIGTSHLMLLNGASIFTKGDFSTPLGIVEVDTAITNCLLRENRIFESNPDAHMKEHSLEVQLPFLQFHLKNRFKIVPIILGTQSEANIKKISDALKPYFNDQNLFIISSDFSHYPTYEGALKADKATGDAIATNSTAKFLKAIQTNENENIEGLVTSCCGWSSILTLLYLTEGKTDIEINPIKYMNSGDTNYGDKRKVVGYHAFSFTRKIEKETNGFSLSDDDKKQLLKIARESIDYWLQYKGFMPLEDSRFSIATKTECGAFVTLHKDGQLRGCIGRFTANEPLYKIVQQMAISAAFDDYRFDPVEKSEMSHIEMEISVLTPLKRINSIDEFELGKQGIYIKKGFQSGTFLPQVAQSTNWSKEEFLGHCARDKAGIGWEGWKNAELYTYEALVFGENEFKGK